MRARDAVALSSIASLGLVFGAGVGACFDLFHSTGEVLTACQVDPATPGCTPDAAPAAIASAVDVCASTSTEARQQADRACAWLGACEMPMGRNAFGPCTMQARLAYDCASNPNHRVQGTALALWRCMLDAGTCAQVEQCVFPAGPQTCLGASAFRACGTARTETASNLDVVVDCAADADTPRGENCAMWGQTCGLGGSAGAGCVGDPAGFDCDASGCVEGTSALHWCSPASPSVDVGIDCADNGAQRCGFFPSQNPQWAACVAGSPADGAVTCTPNAAAECDDAGVATSCPSGVVETLDCATLLGTANACAPGPLAPQFDWTSACAVTPSACSVDSCDDGGATLTGCARGAALSVTCGDQGLGACRIVTVVAEADSGTEMHAACTPPP